MTTNQILSADLLDLIFDDRNKSYGAYELRMSYNKRIKTALLITGSLVIFGIAGAVMANSSKPEQTEKAKADVVRIIEIKDEIEPVEIKKPEEKPQEAQKPLETVKHATYRIVENDEVEKPAPTNEELKDKVIGLADIEGEKIDPNIVIPIDVKIGEGKGIMVEPKQKDQTWVDVQIQAKYVGNWERFLTKNLNPEVPVDNGAPAGRYTAIIQFVVDLDGTVSDIKALTSHGYGIEEEAIRVLRKAAKWEPGIQNGYPVKSYRRQPVTFVVEGF